MTSSEFETILEYRLDKIEKTLSSKAKEYTSHGDRLHNFRRAGEVLGQRPEQALLGMFVKHFVSILDLVDGLEPDLGIEDNVPSADLVDEKIGDAICYLILLEALLIERIWTHTPLPTERNQS